MAKRRSRRRKSAEEYWKTPTATRRSKGFIAAALEEACVSDDGEDALIEAIVAGVKNGEQKMIDLCASYRFGKPTQEIKKEVDYNTLPLEKLMEKLPQALASLTSIGMGDVTVAAKVALDGKPDESQSPSLLSERPAFLDQDLAEEQPSEPAVSASDRQRLL